MKKQFIFLLGILGALLFIVASILGGLQIDGYSFISQYISESYATGLPNTDYLRYMYVASGILFALFGFLAPSKMPKGMGIKIGFFLFAIFYGIGTISTGFFPCDLGCPSEGENMSLAQFIHNISGFLVYVVIPFCLLGIGLAAKKKIQNSNFSQVSIICGVLALGFVVLLFGNPKGSFIGLFQRVIESSILFWVMYTAFFIRRTTN